MFTASSSMGDSRKRSGKPVSGSTKFADDVVEIDRSKFLNHDGATSSNWNTRGVPFCICTCSTCDTIEKGLDCMGFKMEHSVVSIGSESRSSEGGDVEVLSKYDGKIAEMVVKKEEPEVEEIVVSTDDQHLISSDSESEKLRDSDFVVADSASISVEESSFEESSFDSESSFESEEINEENSTEGLNSEMERKYSEEDGECCKNEALRMKYISGDDFVEVLSSSDHEAEVPLVEESFCSSGAESDDLSSVDSDESDDSDFVVESKTNYRKRSTASGDFIIGTSVIEAYSKRTRSYDVKRKKLGSEGEGDGTDIRGTKDGCHDIGEQVHKRRPSIVKGKGEPAKRRRVSAAKAEDILDSILDKGKEFEEEGEAKQALSDIKGLPLKFRFDDEDEHPRKVEKSEFDLMADALFAEMEYALKCEELSFSELRDQVGNGKEDEDDTAEEVNQFILCRKGIHLPYFDEQIGQICYFCKQFLLESKYVLPPLVLSRTESSGRTYYAAGNEVPASDGLKQDVSGENSEGFCNLEEGTVWGVIPGILESMYPHQREGFEFLWKNLMGTTNLLDLKNSDPNGVGGCIISHAPGTGKTRLTLVFVESFLTLYPNSLPVIIAPASVLLTWEEEFRKWDVKYPFHNLNNLDHVQNNDFSRAVKLQAWRHGRSILGVSYNLFEKLAGEKFVKETGKKKKVKVVVSQEVKKLRKILLELPGLVVLDEGHTPRNQRSSIWNTIQKLDTKKRVILSGTPFQNNFGELFNTLRLVRPETADELADERDFSDMIKLRKRRQRRREGTFLCSSSGKVVDEVIERLKLTIAPFVHVHRGSILQERLPGLRDCVVLLNVPALQKRVIEGIEFTKGTFEYEHKLALACVHPSLLLHCIKLTDKENSVISKGQLKELRLKPDEGVKMRFLRKFIPLCLARNEKVLIFSQFNEPLKFIRKQLGATLDGDVEKEVLQLHGKTNQEKRQKLIKAFNDPNGEAKIMLASTKCCSEGISLVGASRVILLDVVWNPSVERQAICRAFRLGQTKVVYTYHLVTCGTTEWEKYCRQTEKDRLSELVFSSSSTSKENCGQTKQAANLDDIVLDDMVNHPTMKEMFKEIIYQPKEKNLIDSFSMVSQS